MKYSVLTEIRSERQVFYCILVCAHSPRYDICSIGDLPLCERLAVFLTGLVETRCGEPRGTDTDSLVDCLRMFGQPLGTMSNLIRDTEF